MNGGLDWPGKCLKCGSQENLTTATASCKRLQSFKSLLFKGLNANTEIIRLNYPVCKKHAKGMVVANFFSRKSLLLSLLRGFIYLMGVTGFSLLIFVSIGFMLQGAINLDSLTTLHALMFSMIIVAGWVIWINRKIPLKIIKQTKSTATIKFKDDSYARLFKRLNRDVVIK